jgi:hypothetical protein
MYPAASPSGGCLPGKEATSRGYTPILIIIDEASRVPDDLYRAVRPMLAVSHGGALRYSEGVRKPQPLYPRASSAGTPQSISSFTGRCPAYQRALDHSQSSALATNPRRTGLA